MKHLIWIPTADESLPDQFVSYNWAGEEVVAAIVPDDFTTPGKVLYDSSTGQPPSKPLVHTFAGW